MSQSDQWQLFQRIDDRSRNAFPILRRVTRALAEMALVLAAATSFAQRSTSATGDYMMDLGQVHGAIRSVRMMEEICSSEYPQTSDANRLGYEEWRTRYLSLIQETERHYSEMALREANGDRKRQLADLDRLEKGFEGHREAFKRQLAAGGADSFRKKCEGFVGYLRSPRMNLEVYYAEQVATIRKGPK